MFSHCTWRLWQICFVNVEYSIVKRILFLVIIQIHRRELIFSLLFFTVYCFSQYSIDAGSGVCHHNHQFHPHSISFSTLDESTLDSYFMYMSKGKWNFLCVVESYQRKKYLSQLITLHVFTLSNYERVFLLLYYEYLWFITWWFIENLCSILCTKMYSSIKFLIFRDCFLTMKMRNKKKCARR